MHFLYKRPLDLGPGHEAVHTASMAFAPQWWDGKREGLWARKQENSAQREQSHSGGSTGYHGNTQPRPLTQMWGLRKDVPGVGKTNHNVLHLFELTDSQLRTKCQLGGTGVYEKEFGVRRFQLVCKDQLRPQAIH